MSPRRPEPSDYYQSNGAPLTERELAAAHGVELEPGEATLEELEAVDLGLRGLSSIGRELARVGSEVAVCRELLELLVDWAGARDRPGSEAQAVVDAALRAIDGGT